jgi:hypothetical protein
MIGVVLSEVNNLGGSLLFEPATEAGTVQANKDDASSGVANWGLTNNFPRDIIDLVAKSTELGALLDWKSKQLHGKRIKAVTRDENGEAKELKDEEINAFLKARTTKRYWREACVDLVWFANVFAELIISNGTDKIAYLGTQDASFCRLSEMVKGKIKNCYVSAEWPSAKKDDKDKVITYDLLDPYSYDAVEFTKKSKSKSFIYPVSIPSPGKLYYQLSSWDGLRLSKWLELMVNIPILKEAYLRNVLNVVFNIGVREDLWGKWYANWKELTDAEKVTIKKAWLKAMNDKLTGVEKGGSSLITEFAYEDGKLVEGVTITAIANPFKDGEHLEDSQEGSAHSRAALGLHSSLVGTGPGKSMGAGSGSDMLVAVKIYDAQQVMAREILLEPLVFIAEYNGWFATYPDLEFEVESIDLNFDKATVRPIGQKGGNSNATT